MLPTITPLVLALYLSAVPISGNTLLAEPMEAKPNSIYFIGQDASIPGKDYIISVKTPLINAYPPTGWDFAPSVLPTISVVETMAPISIPLSTIYRISKRGGSLIPILIGISTLVGIMGALIGEISANNIYVNLSSELAQLNIQIAAPLSLPSKLKSTL